MGNDQVSEIKSKTDIVEIIGERISLSKSGKNFKAPCPFHSERTPSFVVSPDIQFYKCFGCGEHGDVFTFLEKYEGMEFFEALKYLAERTGVKLLLNQSRQKDVRERIYEINSLASRFYSFVLHDHPKGKHALNYLLQSRGIKDTTIKTFNLGYCPDQQFALKNFFTKRKISDSEVEKAGIVYKNGSFITDRFRDRVIFPLYDHRGNIVGFAGRAMPGSDTKRAKYINTPETAVYVKSKQLYGLSLVKNEIKKKDFAVIVEGELDMISSWQAGVKNTVAIKGSALTLEQIKLLTRYTKKVILALDSDFAGNAAARRGIEIADKEGMEIKVAKLTPYKDPDDAARSDPEFYKKTLRGAVAIWDFLIEMTFSKFDKLGGIEKGRISKELVPILRSISDKIVQAHYAGIVAKKLGISSEAVYEQLGEKREPFETVPVNVDEKKGSRQELLEDNLVSVLLAHDPLKLLDEEYEQYVTKPLYKKIISHIRQYMQSNTDFEMSKFANFLPPELAEGFNDLVLKGSVGESVNDYDKEVQIILHDINKMKLLKMRDVVTQKLSKEVDKDKLLKLNEEFNLLTKKLSELEENNHKGIILMNR